jgi:hypothetical protein
LDGVRDICISIGRVIDDSLGVSNHLDGHLSSCKGDLEFGNPRIYGECVRRAAALEGDSSSRSGEDCSPH